MDEAAVIEYRDEDTGTVFRWHGGAYVDVGYVTDDGDPQRTESAEYVAVDVINVWDDDRDQSYLEREAEGSRRPFRYILEAFEARCRQYLTEPMQEQDA